MNNETSDPRFLRLIQKTADKCSAENSKVIGRLRARRDYQPAFDYFIRLVETRTNPVQVAEATQKPLLALLCLQVPLELIHAFGFQPYRIYGGSQAAGALATQGLPTLMCPMLRSVLGAVQLYPQDAFRAWVLPTTCDWMVKFPEMANLVSCKINDNLHWLDLPHLKELEESQNRWLEEVYRFTAFLEKLTGQQLQRTQLIHSIKIYERAWSALSRLALIRRKNRLAAQWHMLITNTFFLDSVERWTDALIELLPILEAQPAVSTGRVFLAGSPIFFPNFKLLDLLEEAGLNIVGDDLCSSERLFPGGVRYEDSSTPGLIKALAERYHQGCLCPTFADNERRVNNILGRLNGDGGAGDFEGVVFHVLKGCHPYDLESFTIEPVLKQHRLKFIRLETDYSMEDSQNLLTRLEAFGHNLEMK